MPETHRFDLVYRAVCEDYAPFPWQRRLFEEMAAGRVPRRCVLPTGLGKSSVVPIWLIALGESARSNGGIPRLPRRLVYIVNRRTIVDQATEAAKRLLWCLYESGRRDGVPWATAEGIEALGLAGEPSIPGENVEAVAVLRMTLGALSGDETRVPLAVSTLRGELADNKEWKVHPARPAIIIGTIDMIGSKLLFSGYGDGRGNRAHHAGLLGQDALIVHDEAHLSPAFSRLLRSVEEEQDREANCNGGSPHWLRGVRVMELSATIRSEEGEGDASIGSAGDDLVLTRDDEAHPVIRQRVSAVKRLSMVEVADRDKGLARRITEQACKYEGQGCRVLIYVRSPERAADIRNAIVQAIVKQRKEEKAGGRVSQKRLMKQVEERVAVLTGTIRGYERDQLVQRELFKRFQSDPDRPVRFEETVYLVSTSAGEVGVDLDADHMVCDLTTLEAMAQRFGRVNRLGGEGRAAEITVVRAPIDKKDPLGEAIEKTAEILSRLSNSGGTGDVSPAALSVILGWKDVQQAFSPVPETLPATDVLFDAWSLTSVRGELPGRPEVAEYLHGRAEWEPPETYVAWRAEVRRLADAEVDEQPLRHWFRACPILSQERLRDRTDRVRKALDKLLKEHRKRTSDENADPSLVLLDPEGEPHWRDLSDLVRNPGDRDPLAFATVVLPVELGGLDGSKPPPEDPRKLDVGEAGDGQESRSAGSRRQRFLYTSGAEEADEYERLVTGERYETFPSSANVRERERILLQDPSEEEDEHKVELVLFDSPKTADDPQIAGGEQTLKEHTDRVVENARRIAKGLRLPERIEEALMLAARWHDQGKDRPVWQRYAGNDGANAPLAKSEKYRHWRVLCGYRHEFGSLLDAAEAEEVNRHPERDLILHLIAAHHGRGRPHFETQAFDRERLTTDNEEAAAEVMRRFGRLQQRLGRWGLAWLESLLRCADALGSQPDPADGAPGGHPDARSGVTTSASGEVRP
ncbi:MAG: type I-U CRISPR-associated helicase/endonuclease Cas3 [Planctomycetota bacterium]|nr:MAG: type I-U CRISPR-associated helicase/endonuclease Cas3 [Planctomycetota bacterium]